MIDESRLLFRAWNGDQMVHFGEGSIEPNFDKRIGLFFPLMSEKFSMTKFNVMQCTGLNDKNGEMIFEGDIVKNERGKIGRVQYLPQECGYVVVLPKGEYKLGHRYRGGTYYYDMKLDIIGNIYENPDLLREEK